LQGGPPSTPVRRRPAGQRPVRRWPAGRPVCRRPVRPGPSPVLDGAAWESASRPPLRNVRRPARETAEPSPLTRFHRSP